MLLSIDGKSSPQSGRAGPGMLWMQQFAYWIAQNLHPKAEVLYFDFEGGDFNPTYENLRDMAINIIGQAAFDRIQALHEKSRNSRVPTKAITIACANIYGRFIPKTVALHTSMDERKEDFKMSVDFETRESFQRGKSYSTGKIRARKDPIANELLMFLASQTDRRAYKQFAEYTLEQLQARLQSPLRAGKSYVASEMLKRISEETGLQFNVRQAVPRSHEAKINTIRAVYQGANWEDVVRRSERERESLHSSFFDVPFHTQAIAAEKGVPQRGTLGHQTTDVHDSMMDRLFRTASYTKFMSIDSMAAFDMDSIRPSGERLNKTEPNSINAALEKQGKKFSVQMERMHALRNQTLSDTFKPGEVIAGPRHSFVTHDNLPKEKKE